MQRSQSHVRDILWLIYKDGGKYFITLRSWVSPVLRDMKTENHCSSLCILQHSQFVILFTRRCTVQYSQNSGEQIADVVLSYFSECTFSRMQNMRTLFSWK